MRKNVEEYVRSLDLEPVILFKQANKGKTIIEKIEEQAKACCYAIVLFSPDDYGGLKGEPEKPRARQNVVLELGYMWGKLGRDKVAILHRENLEDPSDAGGIAHIPYGRKSGWRELLKKDLEGVGLLGIHKLQNEDKEIRGEVIAFADNKSKLPAKSLSLLNKKQVNIKETTGFLSPNITVDFPTPLGSRGCFHVRADQIKGTCEDFIAEHRKIFSKAYPWLWADGIDHGDIILGMIWEYWHNSQEK